MKDIARAKLVIHRADKLTQDDRILIASWLRKLAKDVLKEDFSKRFTARVME